MLYLILDINFYELYNQSYVNGNKVVSHSEILTGKVCGTFSIQKKARVEDPKELSDKELYLRLTQYVMPESSLTPHGYPSEDPDTPGLAILPNFPPVRSTPAESYTCDRCKKSYKVDEFRMPITQSSCVYHNGRLWNTRGIVFMLFQRDFLIERKTNTIFYQLIYHWHNLSVVAATAPSPLK